MKKSFIPSCFLFLVSFSLFADLNKSLPIDPRLEKFTMDNGLEVIIQQNNKPKDKVELWLHIDSGALDEEDNEQGLAHYLEHMAFNGSKNFPAGTLVKAFESMGLTFGLHQNAFTGFDQTTYTITMPNNDEENVEKALLCLSDFAFRLTLTKKEVDRERKVIIEEDRSRSGARQRIIEKLLPALFPKSRVAHRLPIGKMEVVRKLNRDDFFKFYRKWYHPKNATLIVVGDVQKEQIKKVVQKQFSAWLSPKEIPAHLPAGIQEFKGRRSFAISDPEISEVSISLDNISPLKTWKTEADYQRVLKEKLVSSIVNRRLQQLVSEGKVAFQSAYVSQYPFLGVCSYTTASAEAAPGKWQEAYADLVREVRRAQILGFTDRELSLAKKNYLSSAELAVQQEKSQDSNAIAASLNDAISDEKLPISAQQNLTLAKRYLVKVDRFDLQKMFQKNFSFDKAFVSAQFPEKCEGKADKKELLSLLESFEKEKVEAIAEEKFKEHLLDKKLIAGKVIKASLNKDLDIFSAELENGIVYHQRSMDYKKDSVAVKVSLHGGSIEEIAQTKEFSSFATIPFNHHATEKLSAANIKFLRAGKKYSLSGSYEDDMFTLTLKAAPEDLEEGLKLLHIILTSAKIEKPIFELYKQQLKQQIEVMKSNTQAQLSLTKQSLLSGADLRMTLITEKELAAMKLFEVQKFLNKMLKAPIEASIVGDLARDKALPLMNKYLGSLANREKKNLDSLRQFKTVNKALFKKLEVKTVTNKAYVMTGYRLEGEYSVKERRCVTLLSQILSTRLHEEIREKRGLTYGASARREFSDAYKSYHSFYGSFVAEPKKAEEGLEAAREVMKEFLTEGPTDEELKTVKKKIETLVKSTQEKPSYWSSRLADLRYHKTDFKDLATVQESYQSITKEELMTVIKRFYKENQKFEILSLPKK